MCLRMIRNFIIHHDMKKSIFYVGLSISALILILFVSCKDPESESLTYEELLEGVYFTDYYVPAYLYDLESLDVCEFAGSEQTKYGEGIILNFYGKSCNEKTDNKKYLSIASLFGDVSFTQSMRKGKRPTLPEEISVADSIVSISVVSDQDFDDAHPAGALLDDVIYFHAISPYSYVKSHYATWNDSVTSLIDGGYKTIEGYLSELKAEDFMLINCSFSYPQKAIYLDFPVKPIVKTHHLTINMTFSDGKVLTSSCTKVFD